MRQSISIEQAREFSPEQRKRIGEWWCSKNMRYGDEFCDPITGDKFNLDRETELFCVLGINNYLPLLSIGQMLELLRGSHSTLTIDYKRHGEFPIAIYEHPCHYDYFLPWHTGKELVDVLWQAVKEIV